MHIKYKSDRRLLYVVDIVIFGSL